MKQAVMVKVGESKVAAQTYVYSRDNADKLARIQGGDFVAFFNKKHGG